MPSGSLIGVSDGRLLSSAKTDVLTTENTEIHGKKLPTGQLASAYLLAARYEKEAIPIRAVPFCAFRCIWKLGREFSDGGEGTRKR